MSHQVRRRLAALLSGASLVLSAPLLAVPASAASAGPAGPVDGATAEAFYEAQSRIAAAADEVNRQAHLDPATGYSNITVSVKDQGYTLYWKGELPKNVRDLVAAQRARGVAVSVVPSRFTAEELKERAHAIITSDVRVNGAEIISAGPSEDGNSLKIGIDSAQLAARGENREALGDAAAIPDSLTRGIPVALAPEEAAHDTGLREADNSPWFGGALIKTVKDGKAGLCTSSFGAKWPKEYNPAKIDQYYLITAAHCVSAHTTVRSGNGVVIGEVKDQIALYDSAFILVDKASPWFYTGGPVRSASQYPSKFTGPGFLYNGMDYCVSGALTGEVCGGRAVATGQEKKIDGNTRVVAELDQLAGNNMAGKGDSGGPVYSYGTQGTKFAVGILSATIKGQNCKNPLGGNRSECSPNLYVTDIASTMRLYNGLQVGGFA
ncbi:hypothetical protein [Streptomyces sp. NRRL WC-3742]|uniref:hypothetical protein n=1 Tax=Streptomyces sp. NRRL WC-3742 TaxID=1463934 RepID=UPI0004CB6013|nr:hypothetical protein [Streptomyces sp. NRRL WC-3742]